MTGNLLYTLCAPADQEWSARLVNRLIANEYNVYLEPPDEQNAHATTRALNQARIMLVIISQESALGESADVFEDWWRPFAEQGRPIIAIVKNGEPPGVEHWMPFDLRTFPVVNFDDDNAYTELREIITKAFLPIPDPLPALPAPAASPPLSMEPKPPAMQPPTVKRPELPAIPTAQASFAMEQASTRRRERRLWRNVLIGPVVFALLVVLWVVGLAIAETYGSTTALVMVIASVIVGTIVTVIVMAIRGRTSVPQSSTRADIQSGFRSRRLKPDTYIEVISTINENELGKIFAVDRPRLSIGKDAKDDIRVRDRKIDKEHCIIFYSHAESSYYLESQSNKPTVVHDRVLRHGDMSILENGDLVVLGDSVVLQFRTIF